MLASGRREGRETFDASAAAAKRDGDLELSQVGRSAKMPWQRDGRAWHTVDRVAHNGRTCRWEGAALELVIDTLADDDRLRPVNWNDRSIVELTSTEKPKLWFLHAQTGDEWLLRLSFRVHRGEFRQDDLDKRLDLKPIDDLDELPIYGRSERVRVKNLKGPWQEVSLTVHWLEEIDNDPFREFLEHARESYFKQINREPLDLNDHTPWKVLGRKWHTSRKGFPSNKRVRWEPEVADRLLELLETSQPNGDVDWSNKTRVKFQRNGDVWASVSTKNRHGVLLRLFADPGELALGQIANLGAEEEIVPGPDGREVAKILFTRLEHVENEAFQEFVAGLAKRR